MDAKTYKDAENRHRSSTPPPKSVRPPLAPSTNHELRLACAAVVRNNIPSHQRPDTPEKYYMPRRAVAQMRTDAAVLALPPPDTGTRFSQGEERGQAELTNARPYTYKPGVAAGDLFKQSNDTRKQAQRERLDRLMTGRGADAHDAPKTADMLPPPPYSQLDAEPHETIASTPQTEITDDPWSEKISTAVTSAALTPARSSKRTSTQAAQPNSELASLPKLEQVDAEWLRRTLAKKQRVIDDRFHPTSDTTLAGSDLTGRNTDITPASQINDDATSTPRATASQAPRSTSKMPQTERVDSAQAPVTLEHDEATTPPSEQPQHRGRERSRVGARARSISRSVQEYFRPGSSQASYDASREQSRQSSRTRSIGRQIKQRIANSRDGSANASAHGRKSIDSRRSETPDGSRSVTSAIRAASSLRRFRHGRDDSDASTQDRQDSPHRAPSRPLNLNRELPPLPGLDQWKDDEPFASDECISWHPKYETPPPRAVLVLNDVESPPRHLTKASQSGYRRLVYESDSDHGPTFSERKFEMNRQRADVRVVQTSRVVPTGSMPPLPSPIDTRPATRDEAAKRRWWRPQTGR